VSKKTRSAVGILRVSTISNISSDMHNAFWLQLKEGDESGEKTQSFQEKNDPDYVPGAEPTSEDVELAEEDVEPEA
jgi:hypothetical protein